MDAGQNVGARLGNPEQLASFAKSEFQRRTFAGRHPLLIFIAGPIFAIMGALVVVCLVAVGGSFLIDCGCWLIDKATDGGLSTNDNLVSALEMGIMQFCTQGFPRKFVQTPGLIVILYEASSGVRQIFTDGRPLPAPGDPQPWYYGYSSGKWDGDTLVVETNNLRDDGWLDIIGTPLSDQARLTERFRRVNVGRMEIDITVNDPKIYTKPWTVRHVQDLMLDTDIFEFICEENNRFTPK